MKVYFVDGNGLSYEISADDESEICDLFRNLIKAQTEKTKAEVRKLNLEAELKEVEIANQRDKRWGTNVSSLEHYYNRRR